MSHFPKIGDFPLYIPQTQFSRNGHGVYTLLARALSVFGYHSVNSETKTVPKPVPKLFNKPLPKLFHKVVPKVVPKLVPKLLTKTHWRK